MLGINRALRWLTIGLLVLALAFSVGLLAQDSGIGVAPKISPAAISSLPLLTVGLSFLIVQPMIRPHWRELLKNVLLAATFILWGAVQLMAQNPVSKLLGDVVIALYVIDLSWTILGRVNPQAKRDDEQS
jgi:hypothetical protein